MKNTNMNSDNKDKSMSRDKYAERNKQNDKKGPIEEKDTRDEKVTPMGKKRSGKDDSFDVDHNKSNHEEKSKTNTAEQKDK